LRRRRDEWIEAGAMEALEELALEYYDRFIGLELADVAVDGCITKAPCGGEKAGKSPVDRGKRGIKRSTMVDSNGIPLGVVSAPANRHDSPLLAPTLDAVEALRLPSESVSVHLDRGYESKLTRRLLEERELVGVISLNAWCEIWVHHPNKSAKANRGRPNCSLSQMQKLCRATLAAKRARNPLSS
jgi:hypothetical protein